MNLERRLVINVHLTLKGRSALDVLGLVERVGFDVKYVHDNEPWYNAFEWLGVGHKRKRFGVEVWWSKRLGR